MQLILNWRSNLFNLILVFDVFCYRTRSSWRSSNLLYRMSENEAFELEGPI